MLCYAEMCCDVMCCAGASGGKHSDQPGDGGEVYPCSRTGKTKHWELGAVLW
jgi:hypothetical protein